MDSPDPTPEPSPFVKVLVPTVVLAITFFIPRWYWVAMEHEHGSTEPHWYTQPEWWLLAAAVVTFGAIVYQAREMTRATRVMERQTKATEDSVQSLREIERPWIDVTIEAPPQGPMQAQWVALVVKNHGRTVADVKEVVISKEHGITIQDMIGERGFRPVHSKDAEELDGEVLLPPGGDFYRLLNLMPWKTHPSNYNDSPVLVWVWGTVRYAESVTPYTGIEIREHVTNFCFSCRFPVVHSHEEASHIQSDDDLRSRILRGFRKTGPWPLNKYS